MGAEGTVPLDPSDLESLRLVDSHHDIKPGRAEPGIGETLIYDNITVGQARIMTGNVGVENWYRIARRKTTIARNKFGQDLRIMTGEALSQVSYFRRVDHARHLVEHLKTTIPGITIEAPVVVGKKGYDPATKGDTVDLLGYNREETIRRSIGTIPDIEAKMEDAYKEYYKEGSIAKDHLIVMESVELVKNQITGTSCSRT